MLRIRGRDGLAISPPRDDLLRVVARETELGRRRALQAVGARDLTEPSTPTGLVLNAGSSSLKAVAQLVPLPRQIGEAGVRCYGFHGISYEYAASVLPAVAPEVAAGRVIVAHLGSGASLCALKARKSVDCTFSFTPLDGLCMGTRPGSVDPSVILQLEYLLGKQIPYVAIGMINFFILAAMPLIVFGVPIKGSFLMLTLCTLLYLAATTGIGMVVSTFTSSQVAVVFVTAILTIQPTIQFSGLLQPVSTLEGSARDWGLIWPASYYMHSSLGTYTKGPGPVY